MRLVDCEKIEWETFQPEPGKFLCSNCGREEATHRIEMVRQVYLPCRGEETVTVVVCNNCKNLAEDGKL